MTLAAPGAADPSAWPDDAVEVGVVTGAWGIKGGIRVKPFSKGADALFAASRWFIRPPETAAPVALPRHATAAGLALGAAPPRFPPLLSITLSKVQGEAVVATAQELPDRNAAEAMRGARIFIARANFPTAGDGEFYWIDLIGLAVFNRQNEALGEVVGLIDTGPHSVLRLRPAGAPSGAEGEASERLIPFVAAFIDSVSLAERRISVDWGLDY